MTVSELIQRLSAFPSDMPVRFIADDGYISTDDPEFNVDATDEGNGDYDGPDALFIVIN